jgi:hypothetical protein
MINLSRLSMGAKSILLKMFILGLLTLNIAALAGLYLWMGARPQKLEQYRQSLDSYLAEYSCVEEQFLRFSFYSKYDNIVLNNSSEINKAYVDGVNAFANLTQK